MGSLWKLVVFVVAAIVTFRVLTDARRLQRRPVPPLLPAEEPLRTPDPEAEVDRGVDRGFVGVIVAGDAVDIEPRGEARVEEILVRPGDRVQAGALLARLDVRAAADELREAEAALAEASRRWRRRVSAGRAAAFSADEMDGNRRELAQARARVIRLARAVADGRTTAPFAGTVTERYLAAGALAGPGKPLVRLVGQGEPWVRFAVPEERAQELGVHASVTVALAPNGPHLLGRVSGLSPDVDVSARMIYTSAVFAEIPPGAALSSGQIVRVFPSATPLAAELRR